MIFKPFVKVIYSISLTQVALLLLAMYLLTYSGKFHGIDEIAAHVTLESLWREQTLAVPQFQWAQDWTPTHVAIGDDGQLYSKRGLAYTLSFFPFWVIAQFTSAFGSIQMTALASLFATLLTAIILMRLTIKLGASSHKAALIGLLYGLTTLAWPYARLHYSEPFIALCWISVFWWVVDSYLPTSKSTSATNSTIHNKNNKNSAFVLSQNPPRQRAAFYSGLMIGVGLLIHSANGVVLGVLGMWWLWQAWQTRRWSLVAAFIGGVLPFLLLLGGLNWWRFGSPLSGSYTSPEERFVWDYGASLPALLFSPNKGIVWFSPVVVVALAGWAGFWRATRSLALLVLLWSGMVVVLYGGWFMWWGGWSYGPRYLLPLIPLLLLPLVWYPQSKAANTFLLLAGVWGFVVNGLGAVVDFNLPLVLLAQEGISDGSVIWNWHQAAPLAHARLLLQGQSDLAWWAPAPDWPILLAFIFTMILTFFWQKNRIVHTLCLFLLILIALVGISRHPWHETDQTLHELNETIANESTISDRVLVELVPYYNYFAFIQSWMNRYQASPPYRTVLRGKPLQDEMLPTEGTLWLVLERTPPGDLASESERWLLERMAFLDERWFGEFRLVRLLPLSPQQSFSDSVRYTTGVTLSTALDYHNEFAIATLRWQIEENLNEEWKVFVQVLDANGQLVAQHDQLPHNGLSSTTTWAPGQATQTAYALPATADETIIVGLYNPLTGERMRLATENADFVVVD